MPLTDRQRAALLKFVDVAFTPTAAERARRLEATHTDDGRIRAEMLTGEIPGPVLPMIELGQLPAPEGTDYDTLEDYINNLTGAFAPTDATYIVQTAAAALTNAQALGALATGLLKSTTTTGVLSIAVAGTDYAKVPLHASATLDFPSIAGGTCADLTVSVPGAAVNDPVVLGPPAAGPGDVTAIGFVSAADVVTIRLCNGTAAPINPPSATWRVAVLKP